MRFSNIRVWRWSIPEWVVVIALACAIAAAAIAPYYSAELALGSNYTGMAALIRDSEGEYLSDNNDLARGHYNLSSVFYEYKQWPALTPPTGNWLYFVPEAVFGLSAVAVDMLYKVLLPALLTILLYVLFRELTASVFWSAVGALLLGSGLEFAYSAFLYNVLFGNFSAGYLSAWTRPVNPITGMLALVAYLTCLYRLFTAQTKWFLLPGILLGLMIGYFFSFVYAGIFALLLAGVSYFVCRATMASVRIGGVLLVGAAFVAALIGPLVWGLLTGAGSHSLNDPQLQGLFYTHAPFFNKTSLLVAAGFLIGTGLVYWRRRLSLWREAWWLFCAVLLLTNQAVYNIQVVLGWTIWPQHFALFTNSVATLVVIVFIARVSAAFAPRIGRVLGWMFILLLALALAKTLPTYQAYIPALVKFQTYRPTLGWLTQHAENDCVAFIMQDDPGTVLELNRYVGAYTHCDVYNSYHIYQGVPRTRVFDNVMAWLWLKGITPKTLPAFLANNEFWVRSYFFRNWAELFGSGDDAWVNRFETQQQWEARYKEITAQVEQGYAAFLQGDVHAELGRYKLDYIIVDHSSQIRNDLDTFPWLTLVYTNGTYAIYAYKK